MNIPTLQERIDGANTRYVYSDSLNKLDTYASDLDNQLLYILSYKLTYLNKTHAIMMRKFASRLHKDDRIYFIQHCHDGFSFHSGVIINEEMSPQKEQILVSCDKQIVYVPIFHLISESEYLIHRL